MVFRAMRKKPNPAVILDHAGCIMRHGLPCEDREWTLEGRKKGTRTKNDDDPDVNVQQCGKCYGVFLPGGDKCPYCGAPIEKRERKIIEQEGELQQVDIAAIRKERKREQGTARSLRDLVSLGMRKQMKNPSGWAVNVLAARESRKPEPIDYTTAKRLHRELLSEQRN